MQFWNSISVALPQIICSNTDILLKIVKEAFLVLSMKKVYWHKDLHFGFFFSSKPYTFLKIISEITTFKNSLCNFLHFLLSFFCAGQCGKWLRAMFELLCYTFILFNCLYVLWRKIPPRLLCGHNLGWFCTQWILCSKISLLPEVVKSVKVTEQCMFKFI